MVGLDRLDHNILDLIEKEPSYPSEIARVLGVLRTTINYRLNRLAELGYAEKTAKGRKAVWRALFKKRHNKSFIKEYKGRGVSEAYKHVIELPKHSVLYAIQGTEAAQCVLKEGPDLLFKDAHRALKRKGIILKTVTNEKALKSFETAQDDLVRSHVGRTIGVKLFSGSIFSSSGEVFSAKHLLVLVDPKKKTAVVIKDEGITNIVFDTLSVLFEALDSKASFNLNSYLGQRI